MQPLCAPTRRQRTAPRVLPRAVQSCAIRALCPSSRLRLAGAGGCAAIVADTGNAVANALRAASAFAPTTHARASAPLARLARVVLPRRAAARTARRRGATCGVSNQLWTDRTLRASLGSTAGASRPKARQMRQNPTPHRSRCRAREVRRARCAGDAVLHSRAPLDSVHANQRSAAPQGAAQRGRRRPAALEALQRDVIAAAARAEVSGPAARPPGF